MLMTSKSLRGYHLHAVDGDIGKAYDFYFDDHSWTIRYLVADTGRWLPGRLVLLSPASFGSVDHHRGAVDVKHTRDEIERSPSIDTDRPVGRQRELEMARYYGWPMYWVPPTGDWVSATAAVPTAAEIEMKKARSTVAAAEEPPPDPNLRAMREVINYHVEASDGRIGHVEDFVFDDTDWRIHYVVVDTRDWWPGKKVALAPVWVLGISWDSASLRFDLPRERIRSAPEFDPSLPIDEPYARSVAEHFDRGAGI